MPETHIMPDHTIRMKINAEQVPFYPDPLIKPPLRLPDIKTHDNRRMTLDLDLDINKDFEENSPYQEGIISETYERPDKSQLLEPPELVDLINTNNLVQKYLPKQIDIDKMLKIIQRKVLKGTHLPVTIKKIQVGYLKSLYLKEIYLQLAQNKLPSSKSAICKVEVLVQTGLILLDSLLLKLIIVTEKEIPLLAIPEICADEIHHTLSFQSLCGTSRCNKDILNNSRQTFYYQMLCITYCSYIKELPYIPIK